MNFKFAELCFTDAAGVPFGYDIPYLLLAYVIAGVGAYATFELIERQQQAKGVMVHAWHLAASATLGGSLWASPMPCVMRPS